MAGTEDAVVVGSGPNGLAAAVILARAGVAVTVLEAQATIGGGTRTEEMTLPGVLHDVCSATHPFSVASPLLGSLPLALHGLRWAWPEIDLAHPLEDGRVAVMVRSIEETVAGLGPDGKAWSRTFGPLAQDLDVLVEETFRPILHVPHHPVALARFGLLALQPATWVARRWKTDEARALWAGIAAHVIQPLTRPVSAAPGLMLTAAGHSVGWPVAVGGSRAITDALASLLREHGGRIETGTQVRSVADLPPAAVTLFDITPSAMVAIAGDRLPARVRRAYTHYRHGPGAFKVDLALQGGVPWTAEPARRAGTVHLGGTIEQIAAAEAEVGRGRMPERPFVLVGQQALADPSRANGDVQPIWAYAHVPHGWTGDATEAILGQIERAAPGFRERILAQVVRGPADLAAHNPNYVGGDIGTGANDPWQVAMRPRLALDPYSVGVAGWYLCSAATPPGAGVHGMCGAGAAASALAFLGAG